MIERELMWDFLKWIGSSALFLGFAGWLIREIIKHFLSQNTETYKVNLTKDVEVFKASLKAASDKALLEYDIKFRSLHNRRAEIIAEMYEKLVDAISKAASFLRPFQGSGEPSQFDKYIEANNSIVAFFSYFDRRRIFLSEELCERISTIVDKIRDPVIDFSSYITNPGLSEETAKEKLETWRQAWNSVSKTEVPVARRELENEFRRILGSHEADGSQNGSEKAQEE
jgi:hypothetical protein